MSPSLRSQVSALLVLVLLAGCASGPTRPPDAPSPDTLTGPYRLEGHVVDAQGLPVAGAEVVVERLGREASLLAVMGPERYLAVRAATPQWTEPPMARRITRTDGAGSFALHQLPEAAYAVQARDARRHSGEQVLQLSPTAPEGRLTFTLPELVPLRGVVLDEAGHPLGGAQVSLNIAHLHTRQLSTDAQGRFEAHASPVGVVFARVEAPGRAQLTQTLAFGKENRLVLRPGRSLAGRVVRAGKPVAQAQVRASQVKSAWGAEALTDAEGRFRLERLPAESIRLQARQEASASEVATVDLGQGSVEGVTLVLLPAPSVAVQVRDTQGRPLAGARVRVHAGGREPPPPQEGQTDGQGRVRFAAVAAGSVGAVVVEAEAPGYASKSQNLGVQQGQLNALTLTLEPLSGAAGEGR